MNKQERQTKVDKLAADIFARRMAAGLYQSFTAEAIAEDCRKQAEGFYPVEEESLPASVPIKKAV